MGKGKYRPHYGSKTIERISMKPKLYNCVAGATTRANARGAATTWVVSANTWHVMLWFLRRPFLFLGSRSAHTDRPILTTYTSNNVRVSEQGCAFWGSSCWHSPFRGWHSLKNLHFRAVNRRFEDKQANIESFILSKLLHRFQPHFAQR